VKTLRFFLILISPLFVATSFADTDSHEFMTPLDLLNNAASSGINLHNNRNSAATVYGLYVRQYAYVTPGSSCSNATIIYPSSSNVTAGSFVSPTVINAGKSAAIGSNYLYNMIYQTIYYENIIIPSSPPGCALPGCSWGSDTATYNWCIYLGALAPVATSTGYTANVPPSTDAASSSSLYDYNLVNNYVYLGPISCNDQTLSCTVANQQTQSFS
jgi:hypothetical protein